LDFDFTYSRQDALRKSRGILLFLIDAPEKIITELEILEKKENDDNEAKNALEVDEMVNTSLEDLI